MIALVHPSARRFIPFFALLLALFVSGCGINNIPTLEEQAKAKWSDVQNQYQRRADLIPNLVETVKGYAKQEKEVLEAVINARARATQIQVNANTVTDPDTFKKFQEAQAQLSGALGRLIATVENYPDLKSNQNFLALQSQLEGTENRIALRAGIISRRCGPITPSFAPCRARSGRRRSIAATSRWRPSPRREGSHKPPSVKF